MRLKKKIRRVLNFILWGILFAGAGVLLGFADYEQNGSICRSLHYNLDYAEADVMITEADADSLIQSVAGEIKGKPLYQINTEKIERILNSYPYVASAHVYGTNTGDIYINIKQREPVLRIITESNKSYFIGAEGTLLPFHPDYPVRVVVATGAIPDSMFISRRNPGSRSFVDPVVFSPMLTDLHKLASLIYRNPFLKAQVSQIYVNHQGDYELIPKVGNHLILLGDAENLDEKFGRLMIFYKQGLNQIGWNKYKTINIKYKNQVVCSKL
ncbi:cell division protein FtsQ/DivIB [Bacteroidota bacterium]